MKKYNIYTTEFDEDINDKQAMDIMFNLSEICNSYDVEKPIVPYSYIDTNHAGVYVYCQLENDKYTVYWGD